MLLAYLTFALVSGGCWAEKTRLFSAEYKGKYSGMTIKSTRVLFQLEDGSFRITSEIKNFMASINERSDFALVDGIIKPKSYIYARKIMGFKANEKITFQWDKQIAEYRREEKPEKNHDYPISLGVLDPVLYQLQLQRDFFSGAETTSVTFVKSSKVKTLLFQKTGTEPFEINNKTFDAVKIERINLDDDKETKIWLIPAMSYQVARIEHTEEDGKTYGIVLTGFKQAEKLDKIFYKTNPPPTPPGIPEEAK